MHRTLILTAAAAAGCLALAGAPAALAAPEAVSQNWAGYEVTNGTSDFSAVSGGWDQPAARCATGSPTYSAYWVGLGGGSTSSSALEQIGTQSNCTSSGSSQYYAWYELVPAAPVKLDMQVTPGDKMYARVVVEGSIVRLSLEDQTTGATVDRTLHMSNPDTSTAEWVSEAPSACSSSLQDCMPLPLSDFGTVKFDNAYATSGGHTGAISDSRWSEQAISLAPSSAGAYAGYNTGGYGPGGPSGYDSSAVSTSSAAGAQPSGLSSDGSAFSVNYETASSAQATSGSSGTGSGYGYVYGYGGYGSDYGYSGYGASPGDFSPY